MSSLSMLAPAAGSSSSGSKLELPGEHESIWASGRICYRQDDRLASGLGVRFLAMARSQARIVRDYCIEMRRKHLGCRCWARIRA